ncbi:MAG: TonB-dependent siderophore receptor [Reyranella sp.]|uniref:TonB-dependent receptor n=1 Tax=Reyranella sp. TaxID=1929291 RepID=UPI001AC230A1|nr:TonB-dependent siderophore receptor [Reyranella sp.]MBN9088483.1 TonB-dependent siderophore receptor [Reyranella sp.]
MKKRRVPAKTAMVGLLMAPVAALAQQTEAQAPAAPPPGPATQPAPGTTPNQPTPNQPTMAPVTVTGTRPSDDFAPPPASIQRLGGEVRDIPQSITIINKALMQSQGATSFQSAIRNVPGLTLGAAEGGTIGNNINLNGFSARTDLYLDGMRDRGQYYRDIFAYEQVEILMGPSSMLFGRGSTGGVINQVLKKPSLARAVEFGAAATTNGLTRFTADVNTPVDTDAAARVNMMFQRGKASTRDLTDVMDFGFSPSLKFGIGGPTEITLTGLLLHNHDKADYGFPSYNGYLLQPPRNNNYGLNDDYTDTDTVMLNTTVDHKFNKNLSLRNQTQFLYTGSNIRQTSGSAVGVLNNAGVFTPTLFGPQDASALYIRQISRDRRIDDFTVTNQTELNAKFDTGPFSHNLLAGFEIDYDSYRNQGLTRTGRCNNVVQAAGIVGCVPTGFTTANSNALGQTYGNLATGEAWAFAPYINDTIQVLPEVKLVGGVRFDSYWAQIGNSINLANTAGSTATPYMQQQINFVSVRAGALYQPDKVQTYYFSYSTSFNPSLEQLVSTTGSTAPLPPEQNEAFEVGAKYDLFNGGLSLNGALFQITKQNARTQNADGTYSAQGTVQVKGARAGIAGRITPEWQVWGGYTLLDARITNGIGVNTTGMIPLNTPRDSMTLWTTYTFDKVWEIGGGPTYQGLRYANNTNTVIVPDYIRLDATAAYRQDKYDVRLNVFNLTNAYYFEQVMASDGGRGVPGSGLTAMLSLNYRM